MVVGTTAREDDLAALPLAETQITLPPRQCPGIRVSKSLDRQQRDSLIDVVVELSCDPGALLFMGLNQSAAHAAKCFVGQLAFSDI
jgi:hypothetical protein